MLEVGQQLGNYKIVKELGKGGMGMVYKAHQVSLNREVALKVLPKHLSEDEDFIKRFHREAESAAKLNHPNIVQIYDIGEEEGIHYFAMEYVDGKDISQLVKEKGKLPICEIAEIGIQTTKALCASHNAQIVHRDIKPGNIMVTAKGNVKVTDFGLARATTTTTQLTTAGMIVGTPTYMSPEQAEGKQVDIRSDIYSLGVVMYELLTGASPFRAETPTALMYKHIHEKPKSLTAVSPDIPPQLERIILKTLAKKKEDRYENPRALLDNLEEFKKSDIFFQKSRSIQATEKMGKS